MCVCVCVLGRGLSLPLRRFYYFHKCTTTSELGGQERKEQRLYRAVVGKIEGVVTRLEKGELKPRVRAMEVERMIERNKVVQSNIFSAVLSCLCLNSAVSLATLGQNMVGVKPLTKTFFAAAVMFGVRVPYGVFVKLRKLDEYNARFGVGSK